MRPGWGAMATLLVVLAAASALAAPTGPAMPWGGVPQDGHVATFDEAWRIIAETHWDPEYNGVDWQAVRDELRPRAAAAESILELRAVINDMLARLEQSHFVLWPGDALGRLRADDGGTVGARGGDPGFEVTLVGDRFVVAAVDPDGPAAAAGVASGWIVASVGAYEIGSNAVPAVDDVDEHRVRVEAQRAMSSRLSRAPGGTIELGFLDADDRRRDVEIELAPRSGQLSRFGNLPPIFAELESEVLRPDVDLEVGVIAFNIWLPAVARPFDEAIDAMRVVDGIILDLRGNPGGVGGMVMGFGGHFIDENVALGTMRTRDSELRFTTNPRRVDTSGERVEPFSGPLAILIDNTSASTSEVFAGGMQAIGRARVFGQRSMGAVLPSLMDELPNGDVLQHAFADFFVSDNGVRLEGRGVVPDVDVDVSRQDLLEGRDPTFEAAVEWIVTQR